MEADEDSLRETLFGDRPAAEVLDGIFADLRRWSDGVPPRDDCTAVVVAYPGG